MRFGPPARRVQADHHREPDSYLSGDQFDRDADWNLFAIAAPHNVAAVRIAFAEETARDRRDGFTAEELQRAKDAITDSARLARVQEPALAGALSAGAAKAAGAGAITPR